MPEPSTPEPSTPPSPTMKTLLLEPLTGEAFAPFGQVLSARPTGPQSLGRAANQGTATRQDRAAALTSARPHATPNLAVFRCTAQPLPFALRLLERHPHSSQAFLPLACTHYLIVVAPSLSSSPGGPTPQAPPDLTQLRAFLCGPGQGINYDAGIWHHPIVALEGPAEFAMLAWEDGTEGDCEELTLAEPRWVIEESRLNESVAPR